MDGEEPSFVMLSYENYKHLEGEETEDAVENVEVHHEVTSAIEESGNRFHAGLASNLLDNFGQAEVMGDGSDEDKIIRLNEEIALLKNEIKQRELEVFADNLE